MSGGFLEQQIRRSNRGFLLMNMALFSVFLSVAAHFYKTGFLRSGFWGIVLGIVLLFLVVTAIYNVIQCFKRMSRISLSPVYEDLEKIGPAEEIAGQIDAEVASGNCVRFKSIVITKSFVIHLRATQVTVIPVADLLWVYAYIQRNKTGVNYFLEVFVKDGENYSISLQDEISMNEAFAAAKNAAPWAIFGYNKSLEASWKKDREIFLKTVTGRYAEFQKSGAKGVAIAGLTDDPVGQRKTVRGVEY